MPSHSSPQTLDEMLKALKMGLSEDPELLFSLSETEVDKLLQEEAIDPYDAISKVKQVVLQARTQLRLEQSTESETPRFWSNSSVKKLKSADPIRAIWQRASTSVLEAIERGWTGPPFDPTELAKFMGVEVLATPDVPEARTIPVAIDKYQIEFNPNRPKSRIRFSIAHELAHVLFPNCGEEIRYRLSKSDQQSDDWQLEMLCNIAAGEFLMPVGRFPELKRGDVNIENLVKLKKDYEVSMEALLLRVVRLTETPCAVFAASRKEAGRYTLDYLIESRTWTLPVITAGTLLPENTHLQECNTVDYTAKGQEEWPLLGERIEVQCIAIPSFRAKRMPRVVGVVLPTMEHRMGSYKITYLTGDATKPRGSGPKIIAHVVNDRTPNWGAGFGLAIRKEWPQVQESFRIWATQTPGILTLGNIFYSNVPSNIAVVQMICQHGYGPSSSPRLRYSKLKTCLEKLANLAVDLKATIHMPRIGVGEAGGSWPFIEQIIDEILCARGLHVTIYDMPDYGQKLAKLQPSLFDQPL